jgi:hypothetical protein
MSSRISVEFSPPWSSLSMEALHAVFSNAYAHSATYLASGTHQSSSSHRL